MCRAHARMESMHDIVKIIACVLIAGALTFFACAAAHYKRLASTSIEQHESSHLEQLQKQEAK